MAEAVLLPVRAACARATRGYRPRSAAFGHGYWSQRHTRLVEQHRRQLGSRARARQLLVAQPPALEAASGCAAFNLAASAAAARLRRGSGRAARASQRTSVGSPRSANGISIVSKSRGTTVLGEHGAGLVAEQPGRMAGREVGERQHADLRVARERRRLGGGRVAGLAARGRAPPRRTWPRGQHVGPVGGEPQGLARPGVAREDELAARTGRAQHLLGRDAADRLAPLDAAELGTRSSSAEPDRRLGVEHARSLVLVQHVAERGAAVGHRDRRDPVAVALEHVAGRELDELELEADPAAHPQHERHQRLQPGGPWIVSGRSRPGGRRS